MLITPAAPLINNGRAASRCQARRGKGFVCLFLSHSSFFFFSFYSAEGGLGLVSHPKSEQQHLGTLAGKRMGNGERGPRGKGLTLPVVLPAHQRRLCSSRAPSVVPVSRPGHIREGPEGMGTAGPVPQPVISGGFSLERHWGHAASPQESPRGRRSSSCSPCSKPQRGHVRSALPVRVSLGRSPGRAPMALEERN